MSTTLPRSRSRPPQAPIEEHGQITGSEVKTYFIPVLVFVGYIHIESTADTRGRGKKEKEKKNSHVIVRVLHVPSPSFPFVLEAPRPSFCFLLPIVQSVPVKIEKENLYVDSVPRAVLGCGSMVL